MVSLKNVIFCSGFRMGYSTETAFFKVLSDLLLAAGSCLSSISILLDLIAAFVTIHNLILIGCLKKWVGISGTNWFYSYPRNRAFSVAIGDSRSSTKSLFCGVPQGSVLGPEIFWWVPFRDSQIQIESEG